MLWFTIKSMPLVAGDPLYYVFKKEKGLTALS